VLENAVTSDPGFEAARVFQGDRIRLRAVEPSDLDEVMRWINNPEVTQFLAVGRMPVSRAEEERWLAERPANERRLTIETLDGAYVGAAGLHEIDLVDRSAEVGIVIANERNWGKGYGRESLALLADLAFQTLNLHRLYLRVYAYNERAIRVYEKAGFVREGVDRQAHFHGGTWHDVIRMGLLASEWRGANLP
jgi:diamine N-acetyltransferase